VHAPLNLELLDGDQTVARWRLHNEPAGFELLTQLGPEPAAEPLQRAALQAAGEHCSTVDLRL
jgi:hypothetical protein